MAGRDDITSVDLLPPWHAPSIREALNKSLRTAQSLKSAVAYWTIDSSHLSSHLSARLGGPSGFLCVDLHDPTNINRLADLVRGGAAVYLFLEKIKGGIGSRHLLHTKMLLFDFPNGTAELWVGSHNWTQTALGGLNLEATLLIRLSVESSLYLDALGYLSKIRGLCEPFDICKIDYYRRLQRTAEDDTTDSFELYGKGAATLENTAIAIFGDDEQDLSKIQALKQVKVTVFDVDTLAPYNYSGEILLNGPLASYDPAAGGVLLTRRRYAVRRGMRTPVLTGVQEIESWVIDTSKYFVTVHVQKLEPDLVAYDSPPSLWQAVRPDASPLLSRLPESDRAFVFGRRTPQVFHPLPPQKAIPQPSVLETRLNAEDRPLLVKKFFRRPP